MTPERIREYLDTQGRGKHFIQKMPKLLRLHLMQYLMHKLDDLEFEEDLRIEANLKLALFNSAPGRVAQKWLDKEVKHGSSSYAAREVFEALIAIGLDKAWFLGKNIPVVYELTNRGKAVLKKRGEERSAVIGSLLIGRGRGASTSR